MNHFIYAMRSEAPAPASGGTTHGWFFYYKWDIDDLAYVSVLEDMLLGCDLSVGDTLWFVMDKLILGCVAIELVMPDPLNSRVELHYDTRRIQVAPVLDLSDAHLRAIRVSHETGHASDQVFYEALKRSFDAQYPPRNQTNESLPQTTV